MCQLLLAFYFPLLTFVNSILETVKVLQFCQLLSCYIKYVRSMLIFVCLHFDLMSYFFMCLLCMHIGTSVDEITEGLAAFTAEKVFGKFFHQQLLSNIRLSKWLDSWIKIGRAADLLNDNVHCGP